MTPHPRWLWVAAGAVLAAAIITHLVFVVRFCTALPLEREWLRGIYDTVQVQPDPDTAPPVHHKSRPPRPRQDQEVLAEKAPDGKEPAEELFEMHFLRDSERPRFSFDAERSRLGLDFFQFYESGHLLRHGNSIYYRLDGDHHWIPERSPNRYPPLVALLLGLPSTVLNPWRAFLLWVIFTELVLAGSLVMVYRWIGRSPAALLAMLPWLTSSAVMWEIRFGQINFLLAAGSLGMMLLIRLGRRWPPCLIWGVITGIKLAPVLYLPLLIKAKLWRVAAMVLVGVAVLSGAYFLIYPQDVALFSGWVLNPRNYTGVGFQVLLAKATGTTLLPRLVGLPLVALALYLTLRARRVTGELMALWVGTYFLIYNRIWIHHYLIYFAGVALALKGHRRLHLLTPLFLAALPPRIHGVPGLDPYWLGQITHAAAAVWLYVASALYLNRQARDAKTT